MSISPEAQAALYEPIVAIRELTTRWFWEFVQQFWPCVSSDEFIQNWHIEYLCDELQTVAERVANRQPNDYDLIINVPPGTTKTITCSIMFPVCCWTRWPWMRFITSSYSSALSLESADYCRNLVIHDDFRTVYPELAIRSDIEDMEKYWHRMGRANKGNFKVLRLDDKATVGGGRYSTSVGGTLTGFHGHILIVDDPLDPNRAASDKELKNAIYWIDQTLSTRKTDKKISTTILIQQRLHQSDPSGHLLNKKRLKIRHICLPGEIRTPGYRELVRPPELVDKYVDGLMDPNRLDADVLSDLEERLGQFGYAGQIGQNPTPPGGGMFETDKFAIIEQMIPEASVAKVVRYWDKAGSVTQDSAWTVGVKMAMLKNGRFVVMNVKRGRWKANVREEIIRATAEADGQDVVIYHEQEPGSGGKESAEATVKNLAGFVNHPDLPTGDKARRADPYSVQVNRGNVMLLRGDWNGDFVDEHSYFPLSKYKDQVDAASGAFNKLALSKEVWVL